jgi:hypothetical protein
MDDYSAAALATTIDTATKILKSVCGAPTNEYDLEIAKLNAVTGTIVTVALVGCMAWICHDMVKNTVVSTTVTKPDEAE